jgi:hypothetical protein
MGDIIDWHDEKNWWMVCKDCKDCIRAQQGLSLAEYLGERRLSEHYQKEIEDIANRTKKPILSAKIYKKKDGNLGVISVEYTGKGETK